MDSRSLVDGIVDVIGHGNMDVVNERTRGWHGSGCSGCELSFEN